MTDLFQLVSQEIVPKAKPRPRKIKVSIPPAKANERYTATKHCCRICFGRVLKVDGSKDGSKEPTIYRCADCGASGVGSTASICSCAMQFGGEKTSRTLGIRCIENPDRSAVSPLLIVASEVSACS
jgi:hypothetical protein